MAWWPFSGGVEPGKGETQGKQYRSGMATFGTDVGVGGKSEADAKLTEKQRKKLVAKKTVTILDALGGKFE